LFPCAFFRSNASGFPLRCNTSGFALCYDTGSFCSSSLGSRSFFTSSLGSRCLLAGSLHSRSLRSSRFGGLLSLRLSNHIFTSALLSYPLGKNTTAFFLCSGSGNLFLPALHLKKVCLALTRILLLFKHLSNKTTLNFL
jgi:hypothetical protein